MPTITYLKQNQRTQFDKDIAPYAYEIKKQNSSSTTIIIRGPKNDRQALKKKVQEKLKSKKYNITEERLGGEIGRTKVIFDGYIVYILYKPSSGGMSETTLNSTITELAPAIAFMAKKKFGVNDVDKFYKFLNDNMNNDYGVYVGSDKTAGIEFIKSFPSSSKYKEKMKNAVHILNYLYTEEKKTPIKQVYWGYRAKPAGIPSSHKGDLFIEYSSGKMLGVSLKAGGEKTKEPQLNTYVNKMFDDFGPSRRADKQKLIDKVQKKIHAPLGLSKDWMNRTKKIESIDIIESFRKSNPNRYEDIYDEMLSMCRIAVINLINKNKNDTMKYIIRQVLNKDDSVPLVVVKATETGYSFISDEGAIELFLPKVTDIKAYHSTSSKQNWHIDLIAGKDKLTMNMSIRSNKSFPENKIAQGYNLAIKFNGTH